jgi:branched-chain amino acid aminotransferase
VIWLDGQLVPDDEARISVLDHGLTVGDGVFETFLLRDGAVVARRRHLDRLERSMAALLLPCPPRAVLERAVDEVAAANPVALGRLRLTVTGGIAPPGSGRGDAPCTVIAVVAAVGEPPAATTAVVTMPWPRNERSAIAGAKTISYADNVVALATAAKAGASEALLPNTRGELCEGTGSNVFLVLDGQLVTPPLSSGCLAGVSRDLVIESAGAEERPVPMAALAEASEVFLTSSIREIQAVHAIDGRPVPAAPGPVTLAAIAAYQAVLATTLDP